MIVKSPSNQSESVHDHTETRRDHTGYLAPDSPDGRAKETAAAIGIRDLRANLASMTRRAQGGERVLVTIDGEPVAQLGPIEPADSEQITIEDLAVRGLLIPARRNDRPEPAVVMPLWAGTRIDQLVREVRGR